MRSLIFLVSMAIVTPSWADDVDTFLASYVNSYTDYLASGDPDDVKQVVDHFKKPLLQVPPKSDPFVAPDERAVNKNFTGFMARVREAGVRQIQWQETNVHRMGDNHAIASNIAVMLDESGAPVRTSAGFYSLYRFADGWKIIMIQQINESDVLRFN